MIRIKLSERERELRRLWKAKYYHPPANHRRFKIIDRRMAGSYLVLLCHFTDKQNPAGEYVVFTDLLRKYSVPSDKYCGPDLKVARSAMHEIANSSIEFEKSYRLRRRRI